MERVAVVIATHRYEPGLERCLSSVLPLLQAPEDLIFVDNGSRQNLSAWASARFPGIARIVLDQNRLYCGGYNAGIRMAMGRGYEFVLILNADTEVVNSLFMQSLTDAATRWPRAAFLGPLVYWRSEQAVQKTCLQFPRILRNVFTWLPWRLSKTPFEKQPDRETEVEFLNGVSVLCRTAALEEIGLLDENFGGYVEDADWSWRARKHQWSSVFVPVPSIIHHEAATGYEPYSMKTFLLKRNTVLWYLKVGKKPSALAYACSALGLAWARALFQASTADRRQYIFFADRLYRVYQGLLRGESPEEWFGPPHGPWPGSIFAGGI
ncbi:MAG: hypothetical protein H6Q55_759 [Deltaproteobacteria bacterium]|jgi:hypothetical protein|nr:hypothetical protein [Deltaproteobacteria bacterium]